MTMSHTYRVDSDVFITARNLYYAFDTCPGFWSCAVHRHEPGRVFSIDKARSSLREGHKEEDLVRRVKSCLPVDTHAVVGTYSEVINWVQRHPQYFEHAKAKSASAAVYYELDGESSTEPPTNTPSDCPLGPTCPAITHNPGGPLS